MTIYEFERDNVRHRFAVIRVDQTLSLVTGIDSDGNQVPLKLGFFLVSDGDEPIARSPQGTFAIRLDNDYTLLYRGSTVMEFTSSHILLEHDVVKIV